MRIRGEKLVPPELLYQSEITRGRAAIMHTKINIGSGAETKTWLSYAFFIFDAQETAILQKTHDNMTLAGL